MTEYQERDCQRRFEEVYQRATWHSNKEDARLFFRFGFMARELADQDAEIRQLARTIDDLEAQEVAVSFGKAQ